MHKKINKPPLLTRYNMKRDDGYYWIRFENSWIIGEWFNDYERWVLIGFKHMYKEDELQEIDETPITRTP